MSEVQEDQVRASGDWLRVGPYCPTCGSWVEDGHDAAHRTIPLSRRLWIYTNYDCNLRCPHCLVSSSPWAEGRRLAPRLCQALIEEATSLGVEEVFLTGGEPFLLPWIFDLLAGATQCARTTVLSNGLLLRGRRLEKLVAVNRPNLCVEISLDDYEPAGHDCKRGRGSWRRAVAAIGALQAAGVRVRVSTTVTDEAESRLSRLREFVVAELRLKEEDHVVRYLLRRGFSEAGQQIDKDTVVPELTAAADGFYWHPGGTDPDMLVMPDITSARAGFDELARTLLSRGDATRLRPFR
ncbi:MAG: radical SAM protein [Chloroflexota bacterium]